MPVRQKQFQPTHYIMLSLQMQPNLSPGVSFSSKLFLPAGNRIVTFHFQRFSRWFQLLLPRVFLCNELHGGTPRSWINKCRGTESIRTTNWSLQSLTLTYFSHVVKIVVPMFLPWLCVIPPIILNSLTYFHENGHEHNSDRGHTFLVSFISSY